MVESTTFLNVHTNSNNGGTICYWNENDGQFVASKTCVSTCYSRYDGAFGQFCYAMVKRSIENKNSLDDSSIIRINYEKAGCTFELAYGNATLMRSNVSDNNIKKISVGRIFFVSTSMVEYSTFKNNSAIAEGCLSFWSGSQSGLKYCNVLENNHNQFIIQVHSSISGIVNSCFIGNKAPALFSDEPDYTIRLSNCTIDTHISNSNVKILHKVDEPCILLLAYINTENCPANYKYTDISLPPPELVTCKINHYSEKRDEKRRILSLLNA